MGTRTVRRLLAVQGTIQFIAGYIAMEWYRQVKHRGEPVETVLLMYDFLMPEELEAGFVQTITRLAAPFPWLSIQFIGAARMATINRGKYRDRVAAMRAAVDHAGFDELIIGRDFCGDGNALLINAYPGAARILYGDSFGIVGNESVTELFNWRNPLRALASRAKVWLLGCINGRPRRYRFDTAVLSLPMDWSGHYLDDLELLVPAKQFVHATILQMSAAIPELDDYARVQLDPGADNVLYLLSNLAASGYMPPEREAALYVDIIRATAAPGATLFLKPHPRAPRQVLRLVGEALAADYRTVVLDDEALASYPVELWARFLTSCTVVPVYSASAYQIKYIYDKPVLLPLDAARIARYVYPDRRHVMTKGNESIVRCVQALDSWDGRSPLWKGC